MAKTDGARLRECEFEVSGLRAEVAVMKRQWERQLNWARAAGFGVGTVFGTILGAAIWRGTSTPAIAEKSGEPAPR